MNHKAVRRDFQEISGATAQMIPKLRLAKVATSDKKAQFLRPGVCHSLSFADRRKLYVELIRFLRNNRINPADT